MSNDLTHVLETVRQFTRYHPEYTARVIQAATAGEEQALDEALRRAADIEAALMLVLTEKNAKVGRVLALEKVRQWKGQTALKWDSLL